MLPSLKDRDLAIVAPVEGCADFADLRSAHGDRPPEEVGVYFVLLPEHTDVQFVPRGTGGFFKGKNPNVSTEELRRNFVPNTRILYIGKAGAQGKKSTLRNRIQLLSRFGQGKAVGHWGGRYLWQVAGAERLVVAWRRTPGEVPQEVECSLIGEFRRAYGKRPFANLIG